MAYEKLFPFGDERDDYRSACQTFWLRAAWIEDAGEPMDYMPKFDNEPARTEAQKIADSSLESM